MGKGENDKCEWELILEEYKSLRTEELNKMDKQYQIIGLGIGGAATLLALAIQYKIYSLFLLLPSVIISAMYLYHLERLSISKIGKYIYSLEERYIQDLTKIDGKSLGWERCIKEDSGKCPIYEFIELASTLSILFIYLLCVYGILAFPSSNEGFKFINSSLFRHSIALLYTLFGFIAYFTCNFENFKPIMKFLEQIFEGVMRSLKQIFKKQ